MTGPRHGATVAALAAAVWLAMGGCNDSRAPTTSASPPATAAAQTAPAPIPTAPRDSLTDLVDTLARLTTGAEGTDRLHRVARSESVGAAIYELVNSRHFAAQGAQTMLFGSILDGTSELQIALIELRRSQHVIDGGAEQVYYLSKPCELATAVKVEPWWAPGQQVSICPDSYRPKVRRDRTRDIVCGSKNHADAITLERDRDVVAMTSHASGDKGDNAPAENLADLPPPLACGCGPRLIYCGPDQNVIANAGLSLHQEVSDTLSYIVQKDLPYRNFYVGNETYRNDIADIMYSRVEVQNGRSPIVESATAGNLRSSWRTRKELFPGHHAGVLTALHVLHITDGVRDRMRDYFDMAWCANPDSHGATAERILELGITNLRDGEGWKDLASRQFCTGCHARLDYGMQFFTAFPSSYHGTIEEPSARLPGTGPLYGEDIEDPRGVGPLTPHGFAELLVSQPEFDQCVAQRIANHVFSRRVIPEDYEALLAVFKETGRIKPVVQVALERYASRWSSWGPESAPAENRQATAPSPPSPSPRPIPNNADVVALPDALRAQIDDHCISCHDGSTDLSSPELNLTTDSYSREQLTAMLHHVAWRNMPKGDRLDDRRHRDLTVALIDLLWSDAPSRRTAAMAYYLGTNALPTHRAPTIARSVPNPNSVRLKVESSVDPLMSQLTPGIVASVSSAALKACKAESGESLSDCLEKWTDPARQVNANLSMATPPPQPTTP